MVGTGARTRLVLVAVVVVAVGVLTAGCSHGGATSGRRVTSPRVFGTEPDILRIAPPSGVPTVGKSAARAKIDHPQMFPSSTHRQLILFVDAEVSGARLLGRNPPEPPGEAWVGVYRVTGGTTECPSMPPVPPPGKKIVPGPRVASRLFAVIVDGASGSETYWEEATRSPCPRLVDGP